MTIKSLFSKFLVILILHIQLTQPKYSYIEFIRPHFLYKCSLHIRRPRLRLRCLSLGLWCGWKSLHIRINRILFIRTEHVLKFCLQLIVPQTQNLYTTCKLHSLYLLQFSKSLHPLFVIPNKILTTGLLSGKLTVLFLHFVFSPQQSVNIWVTSQAEYFQGRVSHFIYLCSLIVLRFSLMTVFILFILYLEVRITVLLIHSANCLNLMRENSSYFRIW